ncbi:hypothetical protein H5410_023160 [Solanum commersonii]|uniref:Uncharacterized protein n=1 Tax=Solanum commersonii TaxID=4109 RepID=A0A9J5ZIJ9_SOLCO|nr:hypothetical protein H5410_023160 [Solanum commersonii]
MLITQRELQIFSKFKLHFPILQEFISRFSSAIRQAKKDHKSSTNSLTDLVKTIKERVKSLPCLTLANPAWPKIVETTR